MLEACVRRDELVGDNSYLRELIAEGDAGPNTADMIKDNDQRIAEWRDTYALADEARMHEAESRSYRQGWRWGVLYGAVVGGVLVALAFVFGFNAFKG